MYACLHAPGNLARLVECARHFSPLIEETSPDMVVFDIRGLRLIFGAAEQIAAEIGARVGLPANLALAPNPDCAVHAARGIAGTTVILEGREAAALRPLPLYLLGGSSEFAATLYAWGIRTFGEFAALPMAGVAARLGDEGVYLQKLARGEGRRLLRLHGEPAEFREELEPETPVDLLEPLLFLLAQMLKNLCGRLQSLSLAANEIHLALQLERAPDHLATIRLPVPMLDSKAFLKLLQLELSGRPPQAAVERIRLKLAPAPPRVTQHGLFLPASPEPEKLEITLARIRNLVGAANVGAPEPLDTHRPDSFRQIDFLPGAPSARRPETGESATKLALRRFRPVLSARVFRAGNGQSAQISSPKVTGRVAAWAGPWRTSGDWWTGEPWDRDEWEVEIAAGPLLRIYLDRRKGLWFIEGSYD